MNQRHSGYQRNQGSRPGQRGQQPKKRVQRDLTGKLIKPGDKKKPYTPPSGLQAGMQLTMTVEREIEPGYFLRAGEDEVFLHRREAEGRLKSGDRVEVFLYHDHENRLAATMDQPYVGVDEYGWLEVVDRLPQMGVFLDNGIEKDLLLFIDDLPKLKEEWPQPGDRLLVTLKRDKLGRLLAKPVTEEEISKISVPAESSLHNQWVEGTVYKVIKDGAFLFTDEEHVMFIHREEMTEPLRLGQSLRSRVSFVREDGRINGSMRGRKEERYGEDADKLLDYLAGRGGSMPYTDDTPADVVREKFGMSKSAFKRALGKLMKERKVEQAEGWTRLTVSNKE
ncbi:S1-like domain-containing RNA-binding protein [Brevibacillus ruminantium]|uniref:S1-like domain-containing RNA-binding protein n=1 Tax=Brevibacillus ruminantium TaxID=2950604 RepID=A0ABY4WCF9_9BACL|nr:S1-like domain-containing RNA-binding protein [Brevibacillus ruminantium]USG64858.1 S1-like domain-containing RNA-binding protein [Brevibacillus ruminantium]